MKQYFIDKQKIFIYIRRNKRRKLTYVFQFIYKIH
jgi:hypothetical protein